MSKDSNTPLPRGRFAPSPTGRMHLGNVFSALLSWLSVKSKGGLWVLRIEDIDPQRSRKEYADHIMSDLEWLGLTWDEGPHVGGACGPYTQSERNDIYSHYLKLLQEKGMVYPCYCTRADILATQAPHESDGRVVYKGTCRPHISGADSNKTFLETQRKGYGSQPAALRMMVPTGRDAIITFTDLHYGTEAVDLATQCGDFIVRRKDGAWAYQLAVVVDDALMNITEVVRGRDLLLSSPQQIYLAQQLGFSAPSFAHIPLLCNAAGQRLSKRDKSMDMESLRERYTPKELIGVVAHLAGIIDEAEPMSPTDLIPLFSFEKIKKTDITIGSI